MGKRKNSKVTVKYADGTERVASPGEFRKKTREEEYRAYMRSERWRALRRKVIERDGDRCKLCRRSRRKLEVHHLTYVRFGRERLEDLALICQRCHSTEHQWQGFRKRRGLTEA